MRQSSRKTVISREATAGSGPVGRNLLLVLGVEHAANYRGGPGGSEGEGVAEGFGEVAGFGALAGFVADAALPTVKYLRIFSSRFGPMPRTARKSSTLLNAPYDLRICRIFSAVTGPIPGTNCNSSDVAVFKLMGAGGGFLFANSVEEVTQKPARSKHIETKARIRSARII
jgi:hypothetical protein